MTIQSIFPFLQSWLYPKSTARLRFFPFFIHHSTPEICEQTDIFGVMPMLFLTADLPCQYLKRLSATERTRQQVKPYQESGSITYFLHRQGIRYKDTIIRLKRG